MLADLPGAFLRAAFIDCAIAELLQGRALDRKTPDDEIWAADLPHAVAFTNMPVVITRPDVDPPRPHGEVRLHGTTHQQQGAQRRAHRRSSGLLAPNLPLLPRRLHLPVALGVDLLPPPRQQVLRRDVARALFRRMLL